MDYYKNQEQIDLHRCRYPAQLNEEFSRFCFDDLSEESKTVAISIRCAIATLGHIEKEYIRAELSFADLDLLPYWSSCGDAGFETILFIDEIAINLGVKFTDQQLQISNVRDPDLNISMRIFEFVREFYSWYKSLIFT